MRVIAIDPGIERTGYALVDIDGHDMRALEYGCIKTKAGLPLEERLLELQKDLRHLIVTHSPESAAVERLVFVHNTTSALAVGQARGVILLTLGEARIPLHEYAPTEVKRAVTGNGGADKLSVGTAVRLIFKLPSIPQPDDAADALALAVCHAGLVKLVKYEHAKS